MQPSRSCPAIFGTSFPMSACICSSLGTARVDFRPPMATVADPKPGLVVGLDAGRIRSFRCQPRTARVRARDASSHMQAPPVGEAHMPSSTPSASRSLSRSEAPVGAPGAGQAEAEVSLGPAIPSTVGAGKGRESLSLFVHEAGRGRGRCARRLLEPVQGMGLARPWRARPLIRSSPSASCGMEDKEARGPSLGTGSCPSRSPHGKCTRAAQ